MAECMGNRRLIVAASEQGFLPRLFANFNERQKTPINGILLSSALSTVFICLGDFSNLTLFYGVRHPAILDYTFFALILTLLI